LSSFSTVLIYIYIYDQLAEYKLIAIAISNRVGMVMVIITAIMT